MLTAHLPLLGLEPVDGEPLMSVTHGQCNARPTVTFPTARHHRPLVSTKLYCLVTDTHMLTTCPGLHSTAERLGFEPTTYWSQVHHPTTTPPSHTEVWSMALYKLDYYHYYLHLPCSSVLGYWAWKTGRDHQGWDHQVLQALIPCPANTRITAHGCNF